MLPVYHVPRGCETPLSVLVFYAGSAQTQFHSICTVPLCPGTSTTHQCWDRTETILWSDLVVIPDHSAPYQCFWFLWAVPKAEASGGFVPCSLMLGVCGVRRKIRIGAGEYLVPPLEATWKRWSERNRDACLIPLYFFSLYFGVGNLLNLFLRRLRELEW